MLENAWIIPLLPAVSFVLILFFGKRLPFKGSELGILSVGTSFVLSCVAAAKWISHVEHVVDSETGMRAFGRTFVLESGGGVIEPITRSFTWWTAGGIELGAGIQIDGLAVMMMFVVTLISFLVHVYSVEYMKGDRRFTYYYAALSLFTASMLLLVVSNNTLQLLIGWELVGLCSYMLIGHWWEEGVNSAAAMKAFLTTRTGDIGLMIGVILTFFITAQALGTGTFNIRAINEAALGGEVSHTLLLVCASCLLIGIIGKSGQFPLHTWLPDAMAGPTPVSALIHAATMVVAGVYLGARLYPVFYEGFSIATPGINAMAAIGGITILIGAALAFVQKDIKKVLAYSTISQLGYMVMALGVGAWIAAVFHLFTHAFFKALLFLGAGSVSHSGTHHSFDMEKDMGGLRKHMPITFWTFIIGTVALAGVFPFAGFWSKDEILASAGDNNFTIFLVVGIIGAGMTAAYMTRCVYLTFFGQYRGHAHPKESNAIITIPLIVLSVLSIAAGWLNATAFNVEKFKEWAEPVGEFFPELHHPEFTVVGALIALASTATGFLITYLYYWHGIGLRDFTKKNVLARSGYQFLENKYYLDWLYTDVIVGTIRGPIANASYWFNQKVIDGVLNVTGSVTTRIGRFAYDTVDQKVVDGAYNEAAHVTGEAGEATGDIQSGRLQKYALLLFGSVGVIALVLFVAEVR